MQEHTADFRGRVDDAHCRKMAYTISNDIRHRARKSATFWGFF
jgi:hypothetical protein